MNCPLCDKSGPFHEFGRDSTSAGEPWIYLDCPACRLIFLSRPPQVDEVLSHYQSARSHQEADVDFQKKAVRAAHGLLKRIESRVRPGRFIDVGAGPGFYMRAAQERGWEAHGVDPVAGASSSRDGGRLFRGTLMEAGYQADFFDACLIQQSLSHFSEPNATLSEIFRVLRTGGLLLIVAPNFVRGWLRRRLVNWEELIRGKHLYVFTRRSLSRMIEQAGFRVLTVDSDQPVITGERLAPMQKVGLGPFVEALKKLFRPPLRLFRRLAGRLAPGPCIMVLAQKP